MVNADSDQWIQIRMTECLHLPIDHDAKTGYIHTNKHTDRETLRLR